MRPGDGGQCPPYAVRKSPLLDRQQSGVYADEVKVRGKRIVVAPTP